MKHAFLPFLLLEIISVTSYDHYTYTRTHIVEQYVPGPDPYVPSWSSRLVKPCPDVWEESTMPPFTPSKPCPNAWEEPTKPTFAPSKPCPHTWEDATMPPPFTPPKRPCPHAWEASTMPSFTQPKPSTDDVTHFKDTHLHKRLYQEILNEKPNMNTIFSPFSIQLCMALVHKGAIEATAEEISKAMDISLTYSKNIAYVLEKYKHNDFLHIANKAYVKSGYTLHPEYRNSIKDDLKSDVESIEFSRSVEAANAINHWVEEQTNHKIKNIVKPDSLDGMTRLLLVNAVYFKGLWKNQFEMVKPESFTNFDSTTSEVDMMEVENNFKVGRINELSSHVVKLPYQGTNIAMFLIIPDDVQGIRNLERNLNQLNFHTIDSQMRDLRLSLEVPKFDFELELNLNEILKKMGVVKAFGDDADFSRMLVSNEPLYVSKVVHKAFIKVDQKGTEAGAATTAIMSFKSMPPPVQLELRADHPFMFAIVSEEIETPLFMGAVKHL